MENSIELYEKKNFEGRKLVLTNEAPSLIGVHFNDICSSIKVKGLGSWYVYENVKFEGWYLTLPPGDYPDLSEYSKKDDAIASVKPAWTGEPPKPPKAPGNKYKQPWKAIGAWFLGTRAENQDLFNDLAVEAFNSHRQFRNSYFSIDPKNITEEVKSSDPYQNEVKQLKEELSRLCTDLRQSVPFPSPRYQAHMLWDTSMAANLGYMAALLYNQNNVTAECSPVTTRMEMEVAEQLCEMVGYNTTEQVLLPKAWGHITSGGSIANMEALWASRNAKFYPLAVQRALQVEPELKAALSYEVMVPRLGAKKKLTEVSQWDLLNLDLDDIIDMTTDIQQCSGICVSQFDKIIKKYTLTSLGLVNFQEMHHYKQPVVLTPSSRHYSWTKAMTVLGMGDENMIRVPIDEYVRQNVKEMRKILEDKLSRQVPVIAVIAVIGTTAEGAVDPVCEILELRRELRLKGLNFAVLADAAWGGYFLTMLTQSPVCVPHGKETEFVLPLNTHTKKQLLNIRHCDTVTLDPHKTGFVPYPAGGLCYRNGQMKSFVTITSAYVYHDGKEPTVGVFGIGGSQPGASSASCLLSHRAIGLDQNGYGRLLSQIMFGAKLYYCMWMTVAKENDPFVCVNLIPLQNGMPLEKTKEFIRNRIWGKNTWDVARDKEVMSFLVENGSDLLINPFTVNIKGNSNVSLTNKLNVAIYYRLSHGNVATKDVKRVPLILTKSELGPGAGQHHFRQRLGLPCDTASEEHLVYLINTVMNPWQTSIAWIENVGQIFRECVLNCIGEVTDTVAQHSFVVISSVSANNEVFVEHLSHFTNTSSQYHAIAKLKFADQELAYKIHQIQERLSPKPVFIRSVQPTTLHELMYKTRLESFKVECFDDYPTHSSSSILNCEVNVHVMDVPRFQHFDTTADSYPKYMTYWLFGDADGAYMSHVITKRPDFHQVLKLDRIPHSVSAELLDLGIPIHIKSMPGEPLIIDGDIMDPLQRNEYVVMFTGEEGTMMKTLVSFSSKKVWFDFKHLLGVKAA